MMLQWENDCETEFGTCYVSQELDRKYAVALRDALQSADPGHAVILQGAPSGLVQVCALGSTISLAKLDSYWDPSSVGAS